MNTSSIHRYLSRMVRYRVWIGGLIIAVLIGMQLLEALHQHHDGVTEEHCAICLVAAHQIGDAPVPAPVAEPAGWFLLYFTQPGTLLCGIAAVLPLLPYRSRAPPRIDTAF